MTDEWIPNPRPFPTRPPHEWPAAGPAAPEPDPGPIEPEVPGVPPNRGRVGMILGVLAVALVAGVVTYLVLRVVRPPKPRAAVPTTTLFESTTTTTTLPRGPAITAAELATLVDQLIPFVQQKRQLTFTTHPTAILEPDATYSASLRDYLDRSKGFTTRLSEPFDVLGMNPSDANMNDALQAFQGSKSVVFYDTIHNIVHVRAVTATPYLSTMLVVGLTEELDDQHFTTDAIASPTAYGDAQFGLSVLVGGDGWRIASMWADGRSPSDQREIRAELKARRGADNDASKVPAALAAWLRYPAEDGVTFTQDLVTATSSDPLNVVFRTPPDGSAQVLAPARIAAGLGQLPVATPAVDGKVTSSGTFGRLFIDAFLSPVVPSDLLDLAMDGYRGDTLVAYDKPDGATCVRLDVTTGDSDPANMRKALQGWASQRNGHVTDVDDPSRPGAKLVRLDVCSGGGGSPNTTTTSTIAGATGTNSSSTVPGGPLP